RDLPPGRVGADLLAVDQGFVAAERVGLLADEGRDLDGARGREPADAEVVEPVREPLALAGGVDGGDQVVRLAAAEAGLQAVDGRAARNAGEALGDVLNQELEVL